MTNASNTDVEIAVLYIDWPADNERLEKVKLETKDIWEQGDPSPPTRIDSGWEDRSREIASGKSRRLKFVFAERVAPSGYRLEVSFDNGCVLSAQR